MVERNRFKYPALEDRGWPQDRIRAGNEKDRERPYKKSVRRGDKKTVKTGYKLLGSGALLTGFYTLIGGALESSNDTGSGSNCLCFLPLVGMILVVAGNIIIFSRRRNLGAGRQRGSICGLIGGIFMCFVFFITILITFQMMGDIMTSAEVEEDTSVILDEIISWTSTLAWASIFFAVSQALAEGGPGFWAEKKSARTMAVLGGFIIVIMSVISVIVFNSYMQDLRAEYGDKDLNDEEVLKDFQESLEPGNFVPIRDVITCIGHILMAGAAFIMMGRGSRRKEYRFDKKKEPKEYPRDYSGYDDDMKMETMVLGVHYIFDDKYTGCGLYGGLPQVITTLDPDEVTCNMCKSKLEFPGEIPGSKGFKKTQTSSRREKLGHSQVKIIEDETDENENKCSGCGTWLDEDETFCCKCGAELERVKRGGIKGKGGNDSLIELTDRFARGEITMDEYIALQGKLE